MSRIFNNNKLIHIFIILFVFLNYCYAFVKDPDPEVNTTVGEVWPVPRYFKKSRHVFSLDPNVFKFVATYYTCDILEHAIERYTKIIKLSVKSKVRDIVKESKKLYIKYIAINLTRPCEKYPRPEMYEKYYVVGNGRIESKSIWGILRALESYSQLITPGPDGMLQIRNVSIDDGPRFNHRGLLLDSCGHFISVNTIFTILDGMAYDKLNVLHWLLADVDSFPYQSINFPHLTQDHAYMSSMVYTQENITNIIEYARLRGIRVIPEFDIYAIIVHLQRHYFYPEIIKQYENINQNSNITTSFHEKLLNYITIFFREVYDVFPDKWINLGHNLIDARNSFRTTSSAYIFYSNYLNKIIISLLLMGYTPIIIQDNLVEETNLPTDTVMQVKVKNDTIVDIEKLTDLGHSVISSGCWMLDDLSIELKDYFSCYSLHTGEESGERHYRPNDLIGGEAIMWTRYVNDNNAVQTIFPKLSVAAAKLWASSPCTVGINTINVLEEHICRLILRGIYASPLLGPGICG